MMYGHYGYGYGGFGTLDAFWHILIIVAIVCFIMMIFRGGRRGRWRVHDRWHSDSALLILNERYAKGEIDKAEYEERKKTLMQN